MKLLKCALAVCVAAMSFAATAETNYPSKPLRILVIDPAGGALDRLTRVMANKLSANIDQPVVIENRPGGEGVIGLQACARSAPDGYTFCALSSGPVSILPVLKKLPIDPVTDLSLVTPMVTVSAVLYGSASLQAANVKELIALAKKTPGGLSYASFGNGSVPHIVFEYLKAKAGIDMLHVPFQGAAPAMNALLSGTTDLSYVSMGVVNELVQAGKLKAFAASGSTRANLMPAVGTFAEQGIPYDPVTWFGLASPKDVPKAISERIASEVSHIVNSAEFKPELEKNAFQPFTLKPREFSEYVAKERKRMAEIINDARVKADQ